MTAAAREDKLPKAFKKTSLPRVLMAFPEAVSDYPQEMTVTDGWIVCHIATVLRAKPGASLIVVDETREKAHCAELIAVSKHQLTLRLVSPVIAQAAAESAVHVTLAMALTKEQRWDWALQKATELGVRSIQPLISAHTVV